MRQYGQKTSHRSILCEYFLRCLQAFATCFLEMNEVYWELSLVKVIFMVLSYVYIRAIFMWPRGCS